MNAAPPLLTITEAKSKELVPVLRGRPLHSLHNPRREAEVFANNHLAQLNRVPYALVLGLGFGYHLAELSKIMRLKHKTFHIAVIEAIPELARLVESYRGHLPGVEVYTAHDPNELWRQQGLAKFLLMKPVVVTHPPSFETSTPYYETFLRHRASSSVETWSKQPDPIWARAFAEFKHAE